MSIRRKERIFQLKRIAYDDQEFGEKEYYIQEIEGFFGFIIKFDVDVVNDKRVSS